MRIVFNKKNGKYNKSVIPQERLLVGTMVMAHCEWMFETTRAYVKERKAFGKTLSSLPVSVSNTLIILSSTNTLMYSDSSATNILT